MLKHYGIDDGIKTPRLSPFSGVLTAFLREGGINIPQNNLDGLNRLKMPLNAIVGK